MSREARKRRRRRSHGGPARFILIALGLVLTLALAGAGGAAAYFLSIAGDAKDPATLTPVLPGANSELFSSDGQPLGFIQADTLRTPVQGQEIPTLLKNATVAIEDQRFWHNDGIDLHGILRAAWADLATHKTVQGASTITMQLVRNLYLGQDDHSIRQKIYEAKMALRYTKEHPKEYILDQYLNSVPYGTVGGQTAVGVSAAARIFFDKPVSRLSLPEAALLAGLPQAPSQYNPFLDRGAATARRDQVLVKMLQLHYITPAQEQAALATPVRVSHSQYYTQHRESFFFDYVKQQLIDRYGLKRVQEGGLRVYTTINLQMQQEARNAIAGVLNQPGDPAAAVVTINPANGAIEAMAESESYDQSKFNLAAQGLRQPGSTFKAIVLADALSHGVDPQNTYYTSHTLDPGWLPGYPTYQVKTFEGTSLNKSINLVDATLTSDNTVYAQLAADLGEDSVTQMAYRLGVVEHLSSFPAEALGGLTHGVSPLEMANVYATLADGGWRNTPTGITRVVMPGGHVDANWGRRRVKVLSDGITSAETKILQQNIQSGTAARADIGCPAAAKTGTTSDLIDAWLDGYTPKYSTVVWMGYPRRRISMTDVHGQPQQGGYLPAQIWHDYMTQVVGNACVSFPAPQQPISYQPFVGRYQSGGGSSGGSNSGYGYSYGSGSGSGSGSGNGPGGYAGPGGVGAGPAPGSQSGGAAGGGAGAGGTGGGGGGGGGAPQVVTPGVTPNGGGAAAPPGPGH